MQYISYAWLDKFPLPVPSGGKEPVADGRLVADGEMVVEGAVGLARHHRVVPLQARVLRRDSTKK